MDKIKNENSNPDINKKFHKLNLKENEIIEILKENKLKILEKKYVTNMPLLFHFKIFRSNDQKTFNEHLGRKNGYTLNFFGRLLNKFLITFFKKKYCNIYIFYVTKL